MSNRLASETSPYLLQHAQNPVDWYPWGDEAFQAALKLDKPIFLSIGYSACHWCHVMEHESFENPTIAALMNERFVNIKVDREERADLDQIYMSAVQRLTGRGGWPMSVFLTHDRRPFYGGTYWPPSDRGGMPGFDRVLAAIHEAWTNRRDDLVAQAAELTEAISGSMIDPTAAPPSAELARGAEAKLQRVFDRRYGGFGAAPKFPHPMDLRLLLRTWRRAPRPDALEVVTKTLDKMAAGGIYDHLGGGFHRYSVDERWLVPHFEKMLYDNALLARAYLEGFLATGNAAYSQVVRETLDYLTREMTSLEGGFCGTQDADSEGEEGKFYVWTPEEIATILGEPAAKTFCYVYDVSPEGNFEGKSILNLPKTIEQCAKILSRDIAELRGELKAQREQLLAARAKRVAPGLDDKIQTNWNGLAIEAFAAAAGALAEPRYLDAARRAATFILERLRIADGRLLHAYRSGQARHPACLDDYACLGDALVTLYEASFEERWIDEASRLAEQMLREFADPQGGAFFFTGKDHEPLIVRQKDLVDSSVPSGNAAAATFFLRLGKLTGRTDLLNAAAGILRDAAGVMRDSPLGAGQMLLALELQLGPTWEVVLVGDSAPAGGSAPAGNGAGSIAADIRGRFWPQRVLAGRPGTGHSTALDAIFEGRAASGTEPAMYLCENHVCQAPLMGAEIQAKLDQLAPKATAQA